MQASTGPRMRSANEDELVRLYLADIGRHPLLGRDDEERLGKAILRGREAAAALAEQGERLNPAERHRLQADAAAGQAAAEQFVQANLRLVVSVAKRYTQASGLSLLDLVQEGNVGLMQAVERFDVRRGFRFSTYGTWWIRQAIARAISNNGRTIRLPAQAGALFAQVRRAQAALETELGRTATAEEVAEQVGVSVSKVHEALSFPTEMLSISYPGGGDADRELGDVLPDQAPSPFDRVASDLLPSQVRRLLENLTDRERRVICLRYGLDRGKARTLDEVGRIFRLSREQIRQIERRALTKLRRTSESSGAQELLAG